MSEFIIQQRERPKKENGEMERESDGLTIKTAMINRMELILISDKDLLFFML